MLRRLLCASLVFCLCGCATSSRVKQGALCGALTGAALGAGGGWAISDPNLRGSDAGPRHGDTQIDTGASIAAGAGLGLVVGAIVGAMVGHQRDDRIERKNAPASSTAALRPQPQL